jgi:hypothetical protein
MELSFRDAVDGGDCCTQVFRLFFVRTQENARQLLHHQLAFSGKP